MLRLITPPRPQLYTIAAGAFAATGFQPLGLWPLTLTALAYLIHRLYVVKTWAQALLSGWLFGLGLFTAGNGWIATAFTYQAEMPVWLGMIAVVLLALYLAIFPALATVGGWWLARTRSAALLPAFAACWIMSEWLRARLFTGFAWNPLSMVTLGGFDRPGLALLAQWTGTYALSGLVVLLGGWWLFAIRSWNKGQKWGAVAYAIAPAVLMVLPLGNAMLGTERREGTLPFTLVQPNVRQEVLNDPANYENQFRDTATLSLPRQRGTRRLVLWPESGVPDFLRAGYPQFWYEETTFAANPVLARERIGRVIGPGSLLLTGAVDIAMKDGKAKGAYNVVTALDHQGVIRGSYAKAHLVPFGEYLPKREWLEPIGLSRLVAGNLDFFAGPGPQTLDFGQHGKVGVQICYEIIFSGEVVNRTNRPQYLFNPSNDGWFGSWGPPQHLAQARMRAIEEGLPVLRATTTGISAVIDADGVVRHFMPLKKAGRIDGLVPPPHAPTLFAKMGNAMVLVWSVVLLVIALVASTTRKR